MENKIIGGEEEVDLSNMTRDELVEAKERYMRQYAENEGRPGIMSALFGVEDNEDDREAEYDRVCAKYDEWISEAK